MRRCAGRRGGIQSGHDDARDEPAQEERHEGAIGRIRRGEARLGRSVGGRESAVGAARTVIRATRALHRIICTVIRAARALSRGSRSSGPMRRRVVSLRPASTRTSARPSTVRACLCGFGWGGYRPIAQVTASRAKAARSRRPPSKTGRPSADPEVRPELTQGYSGVLTQAMLGYSRRGTLGAHTRGANREVLPWRTRARARMHARFLRAHAHSMRL